MWYDITLTLFYCPKASVNCLAFIVNNGQIHKQMYVGNLEILFYMLAFNIFWCVYSDQWYLNDPHISEETLHYIH